MNKKLSVAIALVAGLLGGLLTRYIAPPTTFAQKPAPVTKEIRAESFTLVDPMNRTIGTFTSESAAPPPPPGVAPAPPPPPSGRGPSGPRIVLRDSNGHEIWSADGTPRVLPLVQR